MMKRQAGAKTVQQILDQSTALASLKERLQLSQQCLKAIMPLISPPMRKAIHAGPVERLAPTDKATNSTAITYWVLLADNTAVASKIRQLQPLMLQHLEKNGLHIQEIKIQVLSQSTY